MKIFNCKVNHLSTPLGFAMESASVSWVTESEISKKQTKARAFVQQQATFGNRRGGMPVQYVLQATTIDRLQDILPKFMEKVYESPIFQMADVNLKFSKPETRITINRDKANLLGVSTRDIAQTLQVIRHSGS